MGGNEQGRVAAGGRAAGVDVAVAVGVEPRQPGEVRTDAGERRSPTDRARAESGARRGGVAVPSCPRERCHAPRTLSDVRYVHAAVPGKHRFPARTCRCPSTRLRSTLSAKCDSGRFASGATGARPVPSEPMFEQLAALADELDRLEADLPRIYAAGDRRASRDAGRRQQELRPVVEAYARVADRCHRTSTTPGSCSTASPIPAERETWRAELADKEAQLEVLEGRIKELLLPARSRTRAATSSSRSRGPRAARRPTSGPATSTGCTSTSPSATA